VVAFDGPAVALTDERLRQIYGSEAEQLHEPAAVPVAPPKHWAPGILAASA